MKTSLTCLLTIAWSVALSASGATHPPHIAVVLDRKTQKTVWHEVANGTKLAAEQITRSGRKIKFVEIDSGTTASATRAAMLEIVKSHPDIIVGEIDSSKAVIAAEVANENGIVFITPFATSPRVTENHKFTVRACVSDDVIGARLASHALSKNFRRAAIVYDGGQLYSVTLKDAFMKSFILGGGEVVSQGSILATANSSQELVRTIVDSKPDVVFLPFYEETVGRFLAQAMKVPGFSSLELLGGDGWAEAVFFQQSFPHLKGTWVTHHDPSLKSKKSRAFAREYEKRFGKKPETSAAFLGFDSVHLAYAVLEKASAPQQAESVMKALRSLQGFEASTGPISFPEGNEPRKSVFLMRYENKARKVLGELAP